MVSAGCRIRFASGAAAAAGVGIGFIPEPAFAYVDPGIAYAALQGVLALAFGVGVAWVMRPWRYLKRLIGREPPEDAERPESADSAAAPPKGD